MQLLVKFRNGSLKGKNIKKEKDKVEYVEVKNGIILICNNNVLYLCKKTF